jgi:hypothetical protein
MASLARPDKVSLDAYSDPQLEVQNLNGVYNRFTNQLKTPILNAKGIQLLNANFINSNLQLNDNGQLVFFYYCNASLASLPILTNLFCVRLYPSTFVPFPGFTAYVKNQYFNSVTELVAALNVAAATGGDSAVINPRWRADTVQFAYDTATRKISVSGASGAGVNVYIAPAAADDPNVLNLLRGTTTPTNRIRMNAFNSANTYATSTLQPYVENVSMNARIGFAMSYLSRGLWWNSTSQVGVATSTGNPIFNTSVEADANPILLGSQNCSFYLSVVSGSGIDSTGRKNLIQTVPIEGAPLTINSYTASSVEKPAISVPTDIYEITVEMLDDFGQPFVQPPNYNVNLALAVYY